MDSSELLMYYLLIAALNTADETRGIKLKTDNENLNTEHYNTGRSSWICRRALAQLPVISTGQQIDQMNHGGSKAGRFGHLSVGNGHKEGVKKT